MSLSSKRSLSVILSHDGKAKKRPSNRSSFDVSKAFPGLASLDNQPHQHHHEDQHNHRLSEPQFRQRNGDDSSLETNSSVSLSRSLANSFNGSSRRSSTSGDDIINRISEDGAPSGLSLEHCANELRRHLKGNSRSSRSGTSYSLRRRKSDQTRLGQFLKNLMDNLDRNRNVVDEFVLPPISGLDLLIELLKEIQTNRRDYRGSRMAHYAHATLEERVCLQCIGKVIQYREHLTRFLEDHEATQVISESSLTEDIDINIAAIQVMSLISDLPEGHARVIEAVSRSNCRLGEVGRLTGIVALLTGTSGFDQKATVVRFFNDLWNSAPGLSAKIFLQHELHLSNFRPEQLHQYYSSSHGAEVLLQELDAWRRNCIDASSLRRNSGSAEVERNMASLRHELEQLKYLLKESNKKIENLESDRSHLEKKCASYSERIEDLQDTVKQLQALYRDRTGFEAEEDLRRESTVDGRMEINDTLERNFAKQTQLRIASMGTTRSDVFIPRPMSPSLLSQSMRCKMTSHVPLPLLHWTPMHAVGSTIFEDMDVGAVLRAVDFSELEFIFQLPAKPESSESKDRRQRASELIAKKIHFVENNRAKNLIITHRKTGLNPLELKLSIEVCDVSVLPGESAQLLLKYIPTREELQQLDVHANSYDELGDAEKILYQISRVERLNAKLAVMVFLGVFDETISKMKPSIELLTRASESVIESERLKGVFEIILVYGNYMNCTKRGYAPGFRLDTLAKLSDVKSQDKSITLLHHLVFVFENNYPALGTFYEDLELDDIKTVSYQAIAEGILTLRKGVELVSEELQNQPNNESLSSFYSAACEQVSALDEPYRKMVGSYRVVCCMFGENYRIIEPAELFGQLIDFVSAFKKASVENFNRMNPTVSARSSDAGRKSRSGVVMANASVAAAGERVSYAEVQANLRKVSRSTTSGPQRMDDVTETSPRDELKKDDPQVAILDVIVAPEKGISDVEAKSSSSSAAPAPPAAPAAPTAPAPAAPGRASSESGSVKEKPRLSAVKASRASHSVYYSAVVKDGHSSSNSKQLTKEVPVARRDLSSKPVNHNDSYANHAQSNGTKYGRSTGSNAGFQESDIYECIPDDEPSSVKSAMKTDAIVAKEIEDVRL